MKRINLSSLVEIIFSTENIHLCVLKIKDEHDCVIQNYRRTEMNLFLQESFRLKNLPLYKKSFNDEFEIVQNDKKRIRLNEILGDE